MVHLKISLLGSFQAWVGGNPATSFESNKVRALLAYLAVEKDRPHTRETIAGLLWPDYPESSALGNLRWALSSLRASIEDRSHAGASGGQPHILARRESLQFNDASDYWLDVAILKEISIKEVAQPVSPSSLERLMRAVSLYRGSFLDGYSLPDSAAFEEWVLVQREYLSQLNLRNLCLLADYFESIGEFEKAKQYVWQQIEQEPWLEEAHQQLMRLLVLNGRRSEALNRYEICRNILKDGLGIEPSKETRLLYERIRDGFPLSRLPSLAASSQPTARVVRPVFVGRNPELSQLTRVLDRVLSGHGQVFFVTGEAGIGKTALVHEFVRRSLDRIKSLVAILGRGNAHSQSGGIYLPFLEAFHMLIGEIQPQWTAGVISAEHVRRLRAIAPDAVKAILEVGSGLIDNFVSRSALSAFIQISSDSRNLPLDNQNSRQLTKKVNLQPTGLFEELLFVLNDLARNHPIILIIDDLQWIDSGSQSLLFYLGKRLEGSRILILGAYRSEELFVSRPGKRHSLETDINELQEEYGDILLDLTQTSSRAFVDEFVDSQPNRLGEEFRETLYRETGGNPLFTVEMMHGLAERGELVQCQSGEWVEGGHCDWTILPPRIKAVIAGRTQRLPFHLHQLLSAASVQGETFVAEVLAAVVGLSAVKIREELSCVVGAQQGLIEASGMFREENTSITRYKFRNSLIQKYLYQDIDPVRRSQLHQITGEVLEKMVISHIAVLGYLETAPANLAWHFEQAGQVEKAVDYLLRAGKEAFALSGYEQAIAFYKRGIGLISGLPESKAHARRELRLQIALQAVLQSHSGYHSLEVGRACARGMELAYRFGEPLDQCASLFSLFSYYLNQADYKRALELMSQFDSLVVANQSDAPLTCARLAKGLLSIFLGDFNNALQNLQNVISSPPTNSIVDLLSLYFQDHHLIASIFIGLPLWFLGYLDQAEEVSDGAVQMANGMGHPQIRGLALSMAGGMVSILRRDCFKTRDIAQSLLQMPEAHNLHRINALQAILMGRYLTEQGQLAEGYSTLQAGLAEYHREGSKTMTTLFLSFLAEACSDPRQGLSFVEEGLVMARETGERIYIAELYRIRGELLLAGPGAEGEAEICLRRARLISRIQGARSLELRAAASLARLYSAQHQERKAYRILASIFEQFTEGFDTFDLRQARQLLERVSGFEPVGVPG